MTDPASNVLSRVGVFGPFRPGLEFLSWALLALCVSYAAFCTLTPNVVGLFHDDGLYAVSARSLAENGQYRISSLPGAPRETKYPPAYSLLLAGVWSLHPEFPSNILWLKSLNLLFIWVALIAYAWLVRESELAERHPLIPLVMAGLLGTCPGVIGFADYTMSDTLFLTGVVLGLAVSATARDRDDWHWAILTGVVCAVAVTARAVGIALAAALVVDAALRRLTRRAFLSATATIAAAAGWYVWTWINRQPGGPILGYYDAYETSALGHFFSAPLQSANIVIGNARMAWDSGWLLVGPAFILWPALGALAILGVPMLLRRGQRLPLLYAACYCPIVLVHPFAPHRYLVPLMPVVFLVLLAGASRTNRLLASPRVPLWLRTAGHATLAVTLLTLLLGNVAWFRYRLTPTASDHVRGWYGMDMGYSWAGFEETFDWIRRNTGPNERLGTMFDPMYYLYTGRQAVRPWIHQPETYFYPYGHAAPSVGDPATVAAELRLLGIRYLVLDPPKGYAEGDAAIRLMREIIRLPSVHGVLVFQSRDGRHEVYRLH